jgi:hypothetical protein
MKNSIAAVLIVMVLVLGCGVFRQKNMRMFEGNNAALAASAIKKKVGADRLLVISAEVRESELKIQVQSPQKAEDIDEYSFNDGTVSGPKPVPVLTLGNQTFTADKHHKTDIDEIDFNAIPETIARAISEADVEGGKVEVVTMDQQPNPRIIPITKEERAAAKWDLEWRIFVSGTRVSKSFWADKKGNILRRAQ